MFFEQRGHAGDGAAAEVPGFAHSRCDQLAILDGFCMVWGVMGDFPDAAGGVQSSSTYG